MPRSEEETERMCALSRETRLVGDLIRFAVSPEGQVVPDTDALAEGRGVWITLGEKQVGEAVRKKAFARSLKAEVSVPADLAELTRRRLAERLMNALSIARKAGQLITGATKVKSAIEAGDVVGLLNATDGAPDGKSKLAGSIKGREMALKDAGFSPDPVPQFELLDSTQLGLALGIENVIHAALIKGGAAQAAVKRAERLARYIAN
jgi:predicted RNA-binding protein YlxR (DUF448 family)